MDNIKLKVYFVCSGLGVVNRGYESFTRECYDAFHKDSRMEILLFKGDGINTNNERKLVNLSRVHRFTKFISKVLKIEPYTLEQITFAISLVPFLIIGKPNVILVSDFELSTYLWHFRKFTGLKYKILFSNGAPNGPPFHRCDHIHQLLPVHYDLAVKGGTFSDKQSIIPYGIRVNTTPFLSIDKINSLRQTLGIPLDAFVVLSVAAVNKHHKRMDYLVNEFSMLQQDNIFLVVLGQMEEESESILQIAREKLPKINYLFKTVLREQVSSYYEIADAFVLASLYEGFGMVKIEALSYGLPVLAHDYQVAREVLMDCGYFADFTQTGALKNLLGRIQHEDVNSTNLKEQRRSFVLNNFSWETLKERYFEMFLKAYNS